jgi:hypothetical protein
VPGEKTIRSSGSTLSSAGAYPDQLRSPRVTGSHSELLVDLKGLVRYGEEGPAGVWSNIAPDGSALFNRDLSTDEIYALDLELP